MRHTSRFNLNQALNKKLTCRDSVMQSITHRIVQLHLDPVQIFDNNYI